MKDLKIGVVAIGFSEIGRVTYRSFTPTMKIEEEAPIDDLKNVTCSDNEADIKNEVEAIVGSWFSKMTEIELADRDEYTIGINELECTKYDDGKVRMCQYEIVFKKRS